MLGISTIISPKISPFIAVNIADIVEKSCIGYASATKNEALSKLSTV
jgi:hypothetical protein